MTIKRKAQGLIYYPESNKKLEERALVTLAQKLAQTLSDQDALEVAIFFPPWVAGTTYPAGTRLRHGSNALYKVAVAHTATEDCPPPLDSAQYTPLG